MFKQRDREIYKVQSLYDEILTEEELLNKNRPVKGL
jgi:hypothetical protein